MTKVKLNKLNAKAELDMLFKGIKRVPFGYVPRTEYNVTNKGVTIYEWKNGKYVELYFTMDKWFGKQGRAWIAEKKKISDDVRY